MKKITVVDLFAGAGGLSYGFSHDDDFRIIAANEIEYDMVQTYALNHPTVRMYHSDIKDFGLSVLHKDMGVEKGDVDLIVGGPPCQAYSTVGKRLMDDPRGKLFQDYFRILQEMEPKAFIFENVKGLLSMQKGALIKQITDLFASIGYKVSYRVLNAADYGVPQIRERVIIVGTRTKKAYRFPEPTHCNGKDLLIYPNLRPYITLSEAIGDLPFIGSGESSYTYASEPQNDFQKQMRKDAPDRLMDHSAPKNNPKLVRLMEALPDGGTPLDIPEALRPKSGFKNTYCRLWWERPSTTITRNLSTPSSSRCIHPKAARPLTTREGARLQCFPDRYIFYGSRSSKNLQIGNAVPTFLSNALAASIKSILL